MNHLIRDRTKYNPAETSLEGYLEDIEKNQWNKTATAKYLGLTFRSLRYRLKKLGLD